MDQNLLQQALETREFVYSAELVLGRDHTTGEADAFISEAGRQRDAIGIISLTDLPGGNPALPPEALLSIVLESGLTPLAHITGKDGNRSFVEARLHHLARLGVPNILALTGDVQKGGFLGRGKPVFDLDSALLLLLIRAMREGIEYSMGSRTIRSAPFDFYPGAVVNPYKTREPDLMMQFVKLRLKIALGARFLITQLGFNIRKLYELKQYMDREGLGGVPVIANIYVPTATIARMMKAGDLAGCIAPDSLIRRLEGEKKPQRLERAALTVAAARNLGFAGAHLGGFGLTYGDFVWIIRRSEEIGGEWKGRIEELVQESAGDFYLFPPATDGLSDASGETNVARSAPPSPWKLRVSRAVHKVMIRPESFAARFLSARMAGLRQADGNGWRHGAWYCLLNLSKLYRIPVLGCAGCGDCIQDHLNYAGCTMRWCYKNLRNGPCGGSRPDGTCEADARRPCIWNLVYENTRAAGEDPSKFARTVIPPRDWELDGTNALANRFAGVDNSGHRISPRAGAGAGTTEQKGNDRVHNRGTH